jgi:hypothetical protein
MCIGGGALSAPEWNSCTNPALTCRAKVCGSFVELRSTGSCDFAQGRLSGAAVPMQIVLR